MRLFKTAAGKTGHAVLLGIMLTCLGTPQFRLAAQAPAAQDSRRLTGVVTDDKGQPLPGVNVRIKGTDRGNITDAAGRFILTAAPADAALVVSLVGFASKEVPIGSQTDFQVQMAEDTRQLTEVVVTALGIEKDARAVTYAQQSLAGPELTRTREPNLINSLAGKVSGVVITRGSSPGSSTRVLLRGNKSITGNNQPLYVIDGIPMNNAASVQLTTFFRQLNGRDGGDAISNLNPDDIESMQVLKGASAAALYGSQAANGVILITTKKGRKGGTSLTLTSNATIENPILLPDLQTRYGQGYGGVSIRTVNDSWGPKISGATNEQLQDFFQTGATLVNGLALTTGNDQAQLYTSYSNTTARGIVPKDEYGRHNFSLRGTTRLLNGKITLDGSATYIQQMARNRPLPGWQNNPVFSTYLFPAEDDFSKYSGSNYEVWNQTRNMYVQNWPYIRNEASSNQNPYWVQNRVQKDEQRIRNIYTLTARWQMLNWLSLTGRVNYDKINDDFEQRMFATTDPIIAGINGAYTKSQGTNDQLYADVLLSGDRDLSSQFNLSATLGFSNTYNVATDLTVGSNYPLTTLAFPNYFSAYALNENFIHTESKARRFSQALFGTATLGYRNMLFLDVTARKEWSSTVNRSFLYPSAGLSFVLTELIGSKGPLSYAKLRASYAEVGNALPFGVSNWSPPYALAPDGSVMGRGALPFFSGSDTLRLQPERTSSYEIGADMRFFNNKLSLGLTFYNATTYDQVFQIAAPAGAGAANFWINGGTIRNRGFEGTLSYEVQAGDFSWTPTLNFSRNINQILELSSLLPTDRFVLNNTFRISQLFLLRPGSTLLNGRRYGSYGDIFGRVYVRDAAGNITYDEKTGLPLKSASNDQYLGNFNPAFLAGFSNAFRYRNWNLNVLVDSRFGGKIVSNTYQWFDFKGMSQRSADARDNGGVMLNGRTVDPETYYKYISGNADVAAVAEEYLYDLTNIRVRELAIGYTFPKASKIFRDISLSVVGRNLFFLYNKAPFDPEVTVSTANSMQGIDSFSVPTTRSFGASLKLNF